MMKEHVFYSLFVIAALVAAMAFMVTGKGKLSIQFQNYVEDKSLRLDSVSYKNVLGQPYNVTMFKYYVGNFRLKNIRGREYATKGYFLINQEEKNSMQISIDNFPEGEYDTLIFTLGIDSMDNCSGAQSGALDPVNGMFWAWNTGYVFLKMEGKSPASNSTARQLEFHIGGYKEPNNCIRVIRLPLKHAVKIGEKKNDIIKVQADVSHLFSAPNPVDFSKLSSVVDYKNASTIADNYATMFKIADEGK